MKKRFIALLLCCVMLLTLSPSLIASAAADDNTAAQSTEGQVTTGETADTTGNNPPVDPQPDANNGGTGAGTENGGSSEENSGKDPASMTDAELYAHVKQLTTDEAIEAFLKQLPEARVNALIAYAQAQEPTVVPKTVVFTDAGPFMPPVNVAMKKKMMRMTLSGATEEPADNGLELSKTAVANNDGTYTIRMEAYTTGEVIHTTKTVPVDIVLVLDQSGSMAYDFSGNSTSTNTARRQYAMKQAVNTFIGKVNEKYNDEANHRMAIVTFGSNASTLQGWTYVDEAGKTTLQTAINGLPVSPSGATNVAAGMEQAKNLMGSGYSYTGKNTDRQKVVIVFTDGVPTKDTNFSVEVANGAISSANTLKTSGVTIYSVGIFKGANPDKIHGDYYYRAVISDTPCDGSVNSYWGTTNLSSSNANDFADPDIPAGNRFLNYISNNYTAKNIGLSFDGSDGLFGGYKWIITANYAGSNAGYYLTADNSSVLNTIFQTISENIQTANIDLGSQTVIKDTVSQYFDLPADVSDIKLYTADYNGKSFGSDTVAPSTVSAEIKDGVVSVTGFDFNANFVSKTEKPNGGGHGKKLIIEFDVTPKDGFIGGNDVPTNDWANSAVYDKSGAEVEKFADATTTPTVNVPIKDVTVTATDKNVYLLHTMTDEECKTGAEATCNGVNLLNAAEYTGVNAWKAEFVTITTNITKPTEAMTADTTYTVSVTVTPNSDGTGADGTANSMDGKTGSDDANINVFKPEVTFKDSQITLGEKANYADNKPVTNFEVWKHGTTLSNAAGVTMIGTAPELTYTYAPTADAFQQDTPVKVSKVEIGNTVVTSHVTFYREACSIKADCPNTTVKVENGVDNFIVHVKSLSLEIRKTYDNMLDPNQSAVFEVSGPTGKFDVVIHCTGSVTINGLPIGEYTVTEKNTWTWRYTDTTKQTVTLAKNDTTKTVSFANTNPNPYWLTGGTWCDNRWIDGSKKVPTPASN